MTLLVYPDARQAVMDLLHDRDLDGQGPLVATKRLLPDQSTLPRLVHVRSGGGFGLADRVTRISRVILDFYGGNLTDVGDTAEAAVAFLTAGPHDVPVSSGVATEVLDEVGVESVPTELPNKSSSDQVLVSTTIRVATRGRKQTHP